MNERDRAFAEAAQIAELEAAFCERTARLHPEDSESRDRLFARARSAMAIAAGIRTRIGTP